MINGFERHGIGHLSASTLNLWVNDPGLWLLEKLLGHRSPVTALMARGRAVEEGIHSGLIDPGASVDDCIGRALSAYDREMVLVANERRESERLAIPGYVTNGLTHLREYGIPTAYQERVDLRLPDVPLPILGYLDWRFAQHGLIVDLKTSERLPSTISPAHARQGAIYARAHGHCGMRFAYVKPQASKKDARAVAVYELDRTEIDRQIVALTQIALRLERFLRLSSDAHELCALVVPDFEKIVWSDPITRARGADVFGF